MKRKRKLRAIHGRSIAIKYYKHIRQVLLEGISRNSLGSQPMWFLDDEEIEDIKSGIFGIIRPKTEQEQRDVAEEKRQREEFW